jgi:aminopeptidase N
MQKQQLMKRFFLINCTLFLFLSLTKAQPLSKKQTFSKQDSLRGSINEERKWWDVQHYAIDVEPDYISETIKGHVIISFKALKAGNKMQIDLQEPMTLNEAVFQNVKLTFSREGNVYHIQFPESPAKNSINKLQLSFSGKPRKAINPPWDGGWIWKKDEKGNPWMSVACQGLGASVWFPCKDHQSDEPDLGASLQMIVPDSLVAVGNGQLTEKESLNNGKTAYTWSVKNPINNYNIIPYIGKYVHWKETYAGEKGELDCSYWVLEYNIDKARKQFEQVKPMLKSFENWFGPYPFYEDGYKLVESPHLGMEHQSAIAYGNKFNNGYLGRDLSGTGWGSKWDFIIIHESGHEWWGNNITTKDVADMWVHESFTNYSETLFTESQYGKEAGNEYCQGIRKNIRNDKPIIGIYGVNNEGSGDMYYKGANMLHTIRQLINNDEKFKEILRGLNSSFYHQTVAGKQIEEYICKKSGLNLSKVFDQYLRTTNIPVLEYKVKGNQVSYRWTNCVSGFNMAVKLEDGTKLNPTVNWKSTSLKTKNEELPIDKNFYIKVQKS